MEAQFACVLNQWNGFKKGRAVWVEEPSRTLTALCDEKEIRRNDLTIEIYLLNYYKYPKQLHSSKIITLHILGYTFEIQP
jgi:hypothetical protein